MITNTTDYEDRFGFRCPTAEGRFLRIVSERTGVPVSVIVRTGGRQEARRLAEALGVLTECLDLAEAEAGMNR